MDSYEDEVRKFAKENLNAELYGFPFRWEDYDAFKVHIDKAYAEYIAIARGRDPKAAAEQGGYIGFLIETPGRKHIIQCGLKKVDGNNILPGIYYRLRSNGIVEVAL